jgi:hypothetical protein
LLSRSHALWLTEPCERVPVLVSDLPHGKTPTDKNETNHVDMLPQ